MLRVIMNSDTRLVQQVLAGQRDRFAVLVERHQGLVHAVAFAHTKNLADAEDVVQDAFLKAFESLPSLREPSRFGPWVATIARRTAYNHLKQRQRGERMSSGDEAVAPNVEEREMEELLRRQMDQLDPDQREILLLRYYAGKSVKEVAAAFAIKPDAAAKRLQRAREALGERLVTVLGESREGSDRARERVVRVMGAVALADVAWQTSAAATAASGLGALFSAKAVVGLFTVAGIGVLAWMLMDINEAPSDALGAQNRTASTNPAQTPGAVGQTDSSAGAGGISALAQAVGLISSGSSDSGAITGRVYNRDTGEGVAWAQVHASPDPYRENLEAIAVSDESGAYRLEGLGAWQYNLRLDVQGYSNRETWVARPVSVGAGATVEGVDSVLVQGCPIRGLVVDEDGMPLSPGSVRAWTPDGRYEESGSMEDDGTFAVGGIPETDRVFVQPVKSGYALAPQGPFELPPEGIDGLVLTMEPEATLSGVVLDGKGTPIEGVQVLPSPGPGQCSGISTEPSDAEGQFTVHGLFAAAYSISVSLPGDNVFRRLDDYAPIEIDAGEHVEGIELICEVSSPGQLAIAGRVVDTAGAPIRGVYVIAERPTWSETQTGGDGRFLIEGLRDADFEMYIWHKQYAPQRLYDIPAGLDDMQIVLEARGGIEGYVVDAATGSPVTDFEILERTRRNHFNGQADYLRVSDEKGRFSLADVEPGERTVLVRANGYAPETSDPVLVHPGQTVPELIVRLSPGRIVEGIVYDPDGQPAQEARIFLDKQPTTGFVIQDYALAVTGADGRFTLESVPAEATQVVAWHPRHAAAHAPIPGGSGKAEVELRLRPGATLQGTVRAEGEPIPDLNVTIGDISPAVHVSQTNEAGEYTIIGLSEGIVEVVANPTFGQQPNWYGRKQILSVEVREGKTTALDFDFDLWPTEVRGRITINGEGPGVDQCYVYLKYEDAPGFSDMIYTRIDEEGNYRLDGARPGVATLEVWGAFIVSRERPAVAVNVSGTGVNDLSFDIDTTGNDRGAPVILPVD